MFLRVVALWLVCAGVCLSAPLQVKDGVLLRDGKPWKGVGYNYYDAFMRMLLLEPPVEGRDPAYVKGFEFLASKDVPFVRFAACGYYPAEWEIYLKHPQRYFELLDGVVREAEKRGIGLIPSLFWAYFAVPDLVGEPISAWGDEKSKTREFMRRYTKEIVTRYKDSPAIWAWEFGNEYITESDIPGPIAPDKWVVPEMKTAAKRSEADRLTSSAVLSAYREFGEIVRSLDPVRPILTGDASPRVSAWNLARGNGWKRDTEEEWAKALAEANPDPIDTLNMHFYHPRETGKGYHGYGIEGKSLPEILQVAMDVSKQTGKPLWLGEFGPGIGEMDIAERRRQVADFLSLIEELGIPLSAYWNFDSPNHELVVWNAAPGNENDFVFEMIREANKRLSQKSE